MRLSNQFFKIRLAVRLALARLKGVRVDHGVKLARGVDFNLGGGFHNSIQPAAGKGEISVGRYAWIEQGCVLWAFGGVIRVQASVFLGPYTVVYGHGGVEIGERTLISMGCSVVSSNHDFAAREMVIRESPDLLLPTKIGRDCWIGAGARILGGVTIGDGCVVGAGAVVTQNLPSNSIAYGVPARIAGQRDVHR